MAGMGGSGADGDAVLVAAGGGWVRLAAPYGSAYLHTGPSLGLARR
jgi:hypothetical protein